MIWNLASNFSQIFCFQAVATCKLSVKIWHLNLGNFFVKLHTHLRTFSEVMIWDLEKFCQFVHLLANGLAVTYGLFVFAGTCPDMFGDRNDLELRTFLS